MTLRKCTAQAGAITAATPGPVSTCLGSGTWSGTQRLTAHDSHAELGPALAPKSARPWMKRDAPSLSIK